MRQRYSCVCGCVLFLFLFLFPLRISNNHQHCLSFISEMPQTESFFTILSIQSLRYYPWPPVSVVVVINILSSSRQQLLKISTVLSTMSSRNITTFKFQTCGCFNLFSNQNPSFCYPHLFCNPLLGNPFF